MLEYSTITNKGDRSVNEDSIAVIPSGKSGFACILCDGLGGHGMGDVASGCVCDTFRNMLLGTTEMSGFLPVALRCAQANLMREQIRLNATTKMKTTAVALAVDDKKAYVAHIGDSRLYIFRKNKVMTRTLDHSVPQMLALCREIREDEIRNHPERSSVLRVMGIEWEKDMFDVMKPVPLRKCDAFLLCSDGFWELITEEKMCEYIKNSDSADEWLGMMTKEVRKNGKGREMDNYSAIAIRNL